MTASPNQIEQFTPFSNLGPIPHLPHITTLQVQNGRLALYTYCGALGSALPAQEITDFICQNSDGRPSTVKRAVIEFINMSAADFQAKENQAGEAAAMSKGIYVSVRMTNPVDSIERPWHTDGEMYSPDNPGDINSVYCTTLLGNPTKVSKAAPANGDRRYSQFADATTRSMLDMAPLQAVAVGDVIRFSFGQPDSLWHASGKYDRERVFILVVYGSKNELENYGRWRS